MFFQIQVVRLSSILINNQPIVTLRNCNIAHVSQRIQFLTYSEHITCDNRQ